jgi:hypothetical protein
MFTKLGRDEVFLHKIRRRWRLYQTFRHPFSQTEAFIGLTPPGSQTTVLWTEPLDDASEDDKIGCNQRCGRDDEAHSSVPPQQTGKRRVIAILLTA